VTGALIGAPRSNVPASDDGVPVTAYRGEQRVEVRAIWSSAIAAETSSALTSKHAASDGIGRADIRVANQWFPRWLTAEALRAYLAWRPLSRIPLRHPKPSLS
jgi:hypothetical protein